MYLTDKAKDEINKVLNIIENEDIEVLAKAMQIKRFDTVPCSKWSILNRLVTLVNGTHDARGMKQWSTVKRRVNKGSSAFYILVPMFRKIKDEDTGEDIQILSGFKTVPVFRVEDTDGEPLDYQKAYDEAHEEMKDLFEVAKNWGIELKFAPDLGGAYGSFNPSVNKISLATKDETTFLHELCHASHNKIEKINIGNKNDYDRAEVIAEFSACILGSLLGKKVDLGQSLYYIKHYSKDPYKDIMKIISTSEKVIELILKEIDSVKSNNLETAIS